MYATTPKHVAFLLEAVDTLTAQSDDAWRLYLIDDQSPLRVLSDAVADLGRRLGERLRFERMPCNGGQGEARNTGAALAVHDGLDYCLYLDADDLADPRRVETVRRIFRGDADVDFIYSAFDLIDQDGVRVSEEAATPSIREILNCFRTAAPTGRNAWARIATETGYVTLTSTVSVRTKLALAHPFPAYFVSEDQHAWLRMTAASSGVAFDPKTCASYRIKPGRGGSSVRDRIGDGYYHQKAWVDSDGFFASLPLALANGLIAESDVPRFASCFLQRCAQTLDAEGFTAHAASYRNLAGRAAVTDYAHIALIQPMKPRMFA